MSDDYYNPNEPLHQPQNNVIRGSGGKFVSKKKKVVDEVKSQDENVAAGSTNPQQKVSTPQFETGIFYGHPIRRKKIEGTWYFTLEDMAILAGYTTEEELIGIIMDNPRTKEVFEDEGKNIESLHFVPYQAMRRLIPLLYEKDHIFPGPFLSWLQEISER